MKNIIWLASYPKSGNTWFRVFLANLLHEKEEPADINRLGGGPIFSSRPVFDGAVGLQSSDMLPDEIDNLRAAVYNELSDRANRTQFIKAHDAYTFLKNGRPLFPIRATLGVIYLIRNPLDIVPSFANHSSCSIDQSILTINNEQHSFCGHSGELAGQLRQKLLGWSGHVKSWLEASDVDVHFIRYEDMKLYPLETFRAAVQFAGLEFSDEDILNALDVCAFEKLQQQEQQTGFKEKAPKVNAFFRKGTVGSWQESLNEKQALSIVHQNAQMMRHFDYLDEKGQLVFPDVMPETAKTELFHRLNQRQSKVVHQYKLYGMTCSLPFVFDELDESHHPSQVQVTLQKIDCHDVDWDEDSLCYKAKPNLCFLSMPGVADYLIKSGQEIEIDIAEGADIDAVKLMLLNTVFGILLIQRGRIPFWGSVVVFNDKAYALIGHSSVGKSFLAAGLKEKGLQVLSDNLCVLDNSDKLQVYPGYPFLMLWNKAFKLLQDKASGFKPVRKGLNKLIYPLNNHFYEQPAPLAGIYLLSSQNEGTHQFENILGFKKMFRLLDFTYNKPLFKSMGMLKTQQKITAAVAQNIPVKRYHYSSEKESFPETIDHLYQDIIDTETVRKIASGTAH